MIDNNLYRRSARPFTEAEQFWFDHLVEGHQLEHVRPNPDLTSQPEVDGNDLAELLAELLSYAPHYFVEKWELDKRTEAWTNALWRTTDEMIEKALEQAIKDQQGVKDLIAEKEWNETPEIEKERTWKWWWNR